MDAEVKKIPNIIIRNIPHDIQKVLVREQAREKENRGVNQYSLSSTVIKIIREWEKCMGARKSA